MAELSQLETALRNADSAGDTEAARALAAEITRLRTETFAQEPKQTFLQREFSPAALKRGAGLAARTLTEWATDIPTMVADIPVHAINALGGNVPTFASSRDALLAPAYGTPETSTEKMVNIASRAAGTGGLAAAGAARFFPQLAQGTGRNVLELLAKRPGLQTVSGGTGGSAAELARQKGVGPVGQIAAGLGGALAPAAFASRAPATLAALQPGMQAAARAGASARVSPGVAATETTVSTAPQAQARGGGAGFGTVGPDPSAGLSIPRQRVAEAGKALGMRLTPGQATGSRALQQLEAKLESQPMTSGPFNTIKEGNQRVLNRAAAGAIGEFSDTVDDATLAQASTRLSGVYENVADDVARNVEPRGFISFLSGLQDDTRGLVQGLTSHPLVDDVIRVAGDGQATGRQLQSIASKLGRAAHKNMTTQSGDRDLGIALFKVKDYVDDLLAQGLSPERAAAFEGARTQYRNLILLTQRVGVVNPSTGNVQGRSLANILQSKDRRGYLFGGNQTGMYNAARFSQAFAPIVGDSGTATRSMVTNPFDILLKLPFTLATKAYTSSPAISLAVGAQAGVRSAGRYGRGLLTAPDVPYGGAFGAQVEQSR